MQTGNRIQGVCGTYDAGDSSLGSTKGLGALVEVEDGGFDEVSAGQKFLAGVGEKLPEAPDGGRGGFKLGD